MFWRKKTVIMPLQESFMDKVRRDTSQMTQQVQLAKAYDYKKSKTQIKTPEDIGKVGFESEEEISDESYISSSSLDDDESRHFVSTPCNYEGCPYVVDHSPDWLPEGQQAKHCCRNHSKGIPEHDELCERNAWKTCKIIGCNYLVACHLRSQEWDTNQRSLYHQDYCCLNHSIGCMKHSKDCLRLRAKPASQTIRPWEVDPLMFHDFSFLKKFEHFHRFIDRGAPYIQIDDTIHTNLGMTNFNNQTPLGHVLNCCQFQQGNFILNCIASKCIELLEQDTLFMVKAARYMDKNLVLSVLQKLFVKCSDPFSISIHNDRGRYWMEPSYDSFDGNVMHNSQMNWKPYKGEPEQLTQAFEISFRINTHIGSYESLEWTSALMNAPNYIFDSSCIRIVEYKWDQIYRLYLLHAIPYQIQSILIMLDTWFFQDIYWLKQVQLGINSFLLLRFIIGFYMFVTFKFRRECSYHIEYEGNNRVKYNLKLFFSNAFNILDLSGHLLIIIYCAIFLYDKNFAAPMVKEKGYYLVNVIHLLAIFLILIRGCLSTFRLFHSTRYLVGMILAVFKDICGFLLITSASCIVFSTVFFFFARNLDEKELYIDDENGTSIYESIKMTYRMMYADYKSDMDISTLLGFIFFVISGLFMIIIMFNLLISIISDTYDRINLDKKAIECRQICQMIFEVELFHIWKRNNTSRMFIRCFEYLHITDRQNDQIDGRIAVINRKSEIISRKVTGLESKIDSLDAKMGAIQEMLKNMADSKKEILQESEEKQKSFDDNKLTKSLFGEQTDMVVGTKQQLG